MTKKPFQLLLAVFLIVLNPIPVFCQTMYSIYDLSQLAYAHSETIKIAQDDLYIAQQDKARALSVLIPRATTYGSMMEHKDQDISTPDTTTLGVKLTQSFTLNGKELIAYDVTKNAIEGKEFSLETTRSQYLFQVAQTYFDILSAEKYLEIALSDVARLTTYRDAVKEKLSVGNVTKTDLYRAEAELSKSMTEKVRAENRVMKTKSALHKLVEIDDNFGLKTDNINRIENFQSSLEDIKTYALKNRTEIKEAKKNIEIAEKTIRFKKSDYWPSVSLEAGYKETDISYDSAARNNEYDTEDLYFSGELVFTVFDGGLRRAEIKQAIAEQRKAKNVLVLQEKQILLDSNTSFLDHKAAKSALVNLQDELKSSQENYKAVQMQFKYGMADSIDIMDANTLLVSAERRTLDAKFIYYVSILKILYTRGDLISFLLNPAG